MGKLCSWQTHVLQRGSEAIVEGKDSNKWSFFEAINLVNVRSYDGFKLWRKIQGLDKGFIQFIDDVQSEKIANHNFSNYVNGHIWVEHGVEYMLSKVLKPDVDQFSKCSDDDSIGDVDNTDAGGIRFDDSEEEITCERE